MVRASLPERLHRHRRRDHVVAAAAVLVRDGEPENPEFPTPLPEVASEPSDRRRGRIRLAGKTAAGEVENVVAELHLLRAQRKIHGAPCESLGEGA